MIDPEFKEKVAVLDKPNGKVIASVRQDFGNEDFLTFSVSDQTSNCFYGTLEYSISGKQVKGWIKKNKYISVYPRNYEGGKHLNLYSEPKKSSKVSSTILDGDKRLYHVTSVKNSWALVKKIEFQGIVQQGWLAPDMQCANAYTTCN